MLDIPVVLMEIVLILNMVVLLVIIHRLWSMRQIRGTTSFFIVMVLMLLVSLFYLMEVASSEYGMKLFWIKIKNIPFSFMGPLLFIFSLNYLKEGPSSSKLFSGVLFIEPILYLLILIFDPFHGNLALGEVISREGIIDTLHFESFDFYLIHLAYQGSLVFGAVVYLAIRGLREEPKLRSQYIILGLALSIPLAAAVGELFIEVPGLRIDWPALTFSISAVIIYLGLRSFSLFRISPIPSETVLDTLDEGVMIIDRNDIIQNLNSAAEKMIGKRKADVAAEKFSELFPIWAHMLDWEKGNDYNFLKYTDEKAGRIFLLRSRRIRDANGQHIGSLLILKNVTGEEKAKDRIKKYGSLLSMINKVLRHDLQNDLMIMQVSVEKSLNSDDRSLLKNTLVSINKSKETIKRMKVLEEESLRQEDLKEFLISNILERIEGKHDLAVELSGNARVLADEGVFTVFNNLIGNSAKHGGADRVRVNISDRGSRVWVDICDNGKGIPSSITENIFDEGISIGETRGSGLGLYIVRSSMERMGGAVSVMENKKGTGACFRLVFLKS